ncbi:DUF1634 domain-containing protein [Enterococcus dongliensis]|uniref:DUF1634 domain-containing protein n=1 Tax=Enterococcus dongliensis TaxID=2559925 RepID=UPI00288EF6C4|nr:DUF1634 domain-containing protein [Enterococcus dongliensis]MDT2634735.1 DUF1634 domain-containing protein [Enterococcus dongliensis]MDT2669283.1 DUF1634 domain-containing protein [Enterococcus dongliensis]
MREKEEILKIERSIGYILRIGVIVSAVIILISMFLVFFQTNSSQTPQNLSQIIQGLFQLKGDAFILLGLFCLILTPILRVVVSIFAFAKEKDYLYVAITVIVLLILLIGMGLGLVEK